MKSLPALGRQLKRRGARKAATVTKQKLKKSVPPSILVPLTNFYPIDAILDQSDPFCLDSDDLQKMIEEVASFLPLNTQSEKRIDDLLAWLAGVKEARYGHEQIGSDERVQPLFFLACVSLARELPDGYNRKGMLAYASQLQYHLQGWYQQFQDGLIPA